MAIDPNSYERMHSREVSAFIASHPIDTSDPTTLRLVRDKIPAALELVYLTRGANTEVTGIEKGLVRVAPHNALGVRQPGSVEMLHDLDSLHKFLGNKVASHYVVDTSYDHTGVMDSFYVTLLMNDKSYMSLLGFCEGEYVLSRADNSRLEYSLDEQVTQSLLRAVGAESGIDLAGMDIKTMVLMLQQQHTSLVKISTGSYGRIDSDIEARTARTMTEQRGRSRGTQILNSYTLAVDRPMPAGFIGDDVSARIQTNLTFSRDQVPRYRAQLSMIVKDPVGMLDIEDREQIFEPLFERSREQPVATIRQAYDDLLDVSRAE